MIFLQSTDLVSRNFDISIEACNSFLNKRQFVKASGQRNLKLLKPGISPVELIRMVLLRIIKVKLKLRDYINNLLIFLVEAQKHLILRISSSEPKLLDLIKNFFILLGEPLKH